MSEKALNDGSEYPSEDELREQIARDWERADRDNTLEEIPELAQRAIHESFDDLAGFIDLNLPKKTNHDDNSNNHHAA